MRLCAIHSFVSYLTDDGHSLVCGLGNRAVQEFTVPLTGKGTAFTGTCTLKSPLFSVTLLSRSTKSFSSLQLSILAFQKTDAKSFSIIY